MNAQIPSLGTDLIYDPLRRLTASTNALGHYTLYNYCPCGGLDSVRDAADGLTYYFSDMAGRTTNVIHPDGFQEFRAYDGLGGVTSVSDSSGYVCLLGYWRLPIGFLSLWSLLSLPSL